MSFNFQSLLSWFGINKSNFVGLDIDPSTVIVLQLTGTKNQPVLQHLAIEPLKEDCMAKDQITDPKIVSKGIQAARAHAGILYASSVIASPSKFVTTHELTINQATDQTKRENFVWQEARKAFPDLHKNLYMDFAVIEKSAKNNNKTQEENILLVVAHKNALQARQDAALKGGLPTKIIDVDYLALERANELLQSNIDSDKYVASLNIDLNAMLLTVHKGNRLIHYFYNQYHIAGIKDAVLKALEDINNINKPQDNAPPAVTLSDEHIEHLINQVRYVLNTYSSTNIDMPIELITLSGRLGLIPNITQLLTEQTGITTELANPFANLSIGPHLSPQRVQALAPACLLCCGLALRNLYHD